jgi:hypothetical protein
MSIVLNTPIQILIRIYTPSSTMTEHVTGTVVDFCQVNEVETAHRLGVISKRRSLAG